jgi:AcrR family transcriptional regulator
MSNSSSVATPRTRADGEASRCRLLQAAVRLFAECGFSKASTRQIAAAANVNIGAISYYFGDKEGLYKAAFTEPMGSAKDDIPLFADPAMSLRQALQGLYLGFAKPLKQDEQVQLCTRLHMREMVEPTGMWAHEIDSGIRPYQEALVQVLCRHLGLPEADDDLHRLAFSLVSQGVFLFMGRDVIQALRPQLLSTPEAIDAWASRMVDNALAMVEVERARRQLPTSESTA